MTERKEDKEQVFKLGGLPFEAAKEINEYWKANRAKLTLTEGCLSLDAVARLGAAGFQLYEDFEGTVLREVALPYAPPDPVVNTWKGTLDQLRSAKGRPEKSEPEEPLGCGLYGKGYAPEPRDLAPTAAVESYQSLIGVLDRALEQAESGKGAQRHATGQPFEEQPMQSISRLIGSHDGLLYQAIKKAQESTRMDVDAAVRELLGAINYLAGAIIYLERGIRAKGT